MTSARTTPPSPHTLAKSSVRDERQVRPGTCLSPYLQLSIVCRFVCMPTHHNVANPMLSELCGERHRAETQLSSYYRITSCRSRTERPDFAILLAAPRYRTYPPHLRLTSRENFYIMCTEASPMSTPAHIIMVA